MSDTLYNLLKNGKRFIIEFDRPRIDLGKRLEFIPHIQPYEINVGRILLFCDSTWNTVRMGIVKRKKNTQNCTVELVHRSISLRRNVVLCTIDFSDIYGILRPIPMNFTNIEHPK